MTMHDARPQLVVSRGHGLRGLLTVVPALRGLRRAAPHHRVVLVTDGHLEPLLGLVPEVDELLPADPDAPLPPWVGEVDVAVDLHGPGPTSQLVLRDLAPRRLVAFRCDAADHPDGPAWRDDEHEVARWCRLLTASGIAADPRDLHLEVPRSSLRATRRTAVLHVSVADPPDRWPLERWAALARHERDRGCQVNLTGRASDVALARRIARAAGLPARTVTAGRTSLTGLVRIVAAADHVVAGDTGVAHLATALRTPSVVLFGPTSPSRWGPPPLPRHRALWPGRGGASVAEIALEAVVQALETLPECGWR